MLKKSPNPLPQAFITPNRSTTPKLTLQTFSTRTLKPSDPAGLTFNPENSKTFANFPAFIQVNEFHNKATNTDHSRIFTQNNLDWKINYNDKVVKEEGLGKIDTAILVSLPDDSSSKASSAGHNGHGHGHLPVGFVNRITTHANELYNFLYAKAEITLLYLYNLEPYHDWSKFPDAFAEAGTDTSKIAASAFGVRKLIVATSKNSDIIYILDSKNGKIFKKIPVPHLEEADKTILLNTGELEVVLVAVNDQNQLIRLIKFDASSPVSDTTFDDYTHDFEVHIKVEHILENCLIFENGQKFEFSPDSSKGHDKVFFTETEADSLVRGKMLDLKSSKISNLWQFTIETGHEIVTIKKGSGAITNAIGRALRDRSIQYKYLNPHMLSIITQWTSEENVPTLTLSVLDSITGNLIYSHNQANAKTPVKLAQIDNWVAFTYWDTKKRRFNIESIEFYKGKAHTFAQMKDFQFNQNKYSSSSAKLGANELTVLKQGYILPFEPSNLQPTFTKNGITQRSLLISVADRGQLILIPHNMVDARRVPITYNYDDNGVLQPAVNAKNFDDSKELPGAYMPQINTGTKQLLSTNRTIAGIENIVVSPAKLESTCVAFAYGDLDCYFINNITPSEAFDKMDGNSTTKIGLLGSCIGLFLLTLFLKQQTKWHQITKSWK